MMQEPVMDRGEFLRDLTRAGLFIGLTGLGMALARRPRNGQCTKHAHCRMCPEYAGCALQRPWDDTRE